MHEYIVVKDKSGLRRLIFIRAITSIEEQDDGSTSIYTVDNHCFDVSKEQCSFDELHRSMAEARRLYA
jgi:hypothetical protein